MSVLFGPDAENVKRHKTPANMNEEDRKLNRRVEIFLEVSTVPIPSPAPPINIHLTPADIREITNGWWQDEQRKNRNRWSKPVPDPKRPDQWRDFVKDVKDMLKKRFGDQNVQVDLKSVFDTIHDLIKEPDKDWTDDFMRAWQDIEEERKQKGLDPLGSDDDDWSRSIDGGLGCACVWARNAEETGREAAWLLRGQEKYPKPCIVSSASRNSRTVAFDPAK